MNIQIIEDSNVLNNMKDEYDEEEIFDSIQDKIDLNLIERFYADDIDFTQTELLKLINDLNYIDNKYLIDSIIIYKIAGYKIKDLYFFPQQYLDEFNEEDPVKLAFKYETIKVLDFLYLMKLIVPKEWFKYSVKNGYTKSVEWIIEKDSSVDLNEGLILASKNRHTEIVKLLLDQGADIHAENEEAIRSACEYGFTEIVKLILDRGADIHDFNKGLLVHASLNGHTETVRLLLDRGADIHIDDDLALRVASDSGFTETVRLLLDRGANVHADNDYSLRWANENGYTETLRLLLDRGANPDVLN